MPTQRHELGPRPSPPATLGESIPMPPALRDLLPTLARRAAVMLATGELVENPDGSYTRVSTIEADENQAA